MALTLAKQWHVQHETGLSMLGCCCYRSCRTYGLIAKYTDCIFVSGYFPAVCSTCRTPRTRTSPPGSCGCARGSSGCTAWWTGAGRTCTRTRTLAASWDGSRPCRDCRCQFAAWRDTFWWMMLGRICWWWWLWVWLIDLSIKFLTEVWWEVIFFNCIVFLEELLSVMCLLLAIFFFFFLSGAIMSVGYVL